MDPPINFAKKYFDAKPEIKFKTDFSKVKINEYIQKLNEKNSSGDLTGLINTLKQLTDATLTPDFEGSIKNIIDNRKGGRKRSYKKRSHKRKTHRRKR